jgi:hypothetical protein
LIVPALRAGGLRGWRAAATRHVLCYEFVAQAALGRKQRAREMLVECRELATRVDAPELDRAIDLSEAMLDWFGPRMLQARARLAKLLRRLEEAPGADWVRAYAAIRMPRLVWWLAGELRRELPAGHDRVSGQLTTRLAAGMTRPSVWTSTS